MRTSSRIAGTPAAVAVVAALLAGCGGTAATGAATPAGGTAAPAPSGSTRLASAYARTTAADTARISYGVTIVAHGHTTTVAGTGVLSEHPQAAQIVLHVNAGSKAIALQERLIAGAVYIQLPSQVAPGAPSWVEVTGLPSGTSQTGIDPNQALALLEADATGIRRVGTPALDGVRTTEYVANLQIGRAVARTRSAILRTAMSRFRASTGLASLPVDVWIDSAGRVRRLTMDLTLPSGSSGAAGALAGARFELTLDVSDFGVPVHVTAPPASSVRKIDAGSLSGLS